MCHMAHLEGKGTPEHECRPTVNQVGEPEIVVVHEDTKHHFKGAQISRIRIRSHRQDPTRYYVDQLRFELICAKICIEHLCIYIHTSYKMP